MQLPNTNMPLLLLLNEQSEKTTMSQVGKLLDMIIQRSAKAFYGFVEALVMTDQEHAAEFLDCDLTMKLVLRRDAEMGQNTHQSSSTHSAVAPSGAAVTTRSSATNTPSSHMNPVPVPPTPTHSGMYLLCIHSSVLMYPFVSIIRPVKNLEPAIPKGFSLGDL